MGKLYDRYLTYATYNRLSESPGEGEEPVTPTLFRGETGKKLVSSR